MSAGDSKVIPFTARPAPGTAATRLSQLAAEAPLRVLIVDDSPEDRMIVRLALESQGYLLSEVDNGERGVAAAVALRPHCILLDYHLPDLDGLEVLNALRQPDGSMPCAVVMLTGSSSGEAAAKLLKAGALDYLGKGHLSEDSLRRAVQGAVERYLLIEERHRAEVRNAYLASIVESSSDAIFSTDLDDRIRSWNPGAAALFGYTADEAIGQLVEELIVPEHLIEQRRERYRDVMAGRVPRKVETERRRKDGKLVPVEVNASPMFDASGGVIGISAVMRDITERRRTETELRERRNFLDGIFEVLPGVLYIFDLDENRVVFVNNTAEGTYSSEEIMAMGADVLANLMHPDDQQGFQEHVARIRTLNSGETATFEYRMRDKADEWRWYMGTDTVFWRDESGVARQLIGVAPEITDRKRAEVAMRESESQQTFLLELSDRLRTAADATAAMTAAAELFARHCGLSLAQYLIIDPDGDRFEVLARYSDGWLPAALRQSGRLSDHGPDWAPQFRNGESVFSDDHDDRPEADANASQALGIRSGSAVPLLRNGRLEAMFATASPEPRRWTTAEKALQHEVAQRTWAAVERARAEERLQAAHDTFRHLINRSPFGMYVINADFRLVQISDGGQKAFGNVRPLIGRDFTEVVRAVWPDPFAGEVIAHFRHTLATGEPFNAETNERRADIEATEAHDWKIERVILPDGRFGVVCHFYDLSERKRQEEHIQLLMSEVNHRSKNMLSLVQAIAKRTIATRPEDFIERFGQRMQALAASQDLLVKSEWKAVPLGDLVRSQLAHFGDALDTRVALDGPPVAITASASQALGMALHELATNAAKYGALSNEVGRVAIGWNLQSDAAGKARFTMSWVESGGPPVAKPTRHGFGSTVTGAMIKMSLGCDAEIDFAPTGLVWRIDCPAEGMIEGSALSAPQSNGAALEEQPAQASGRRRVLVVEDEPLIALDIAHTLAEAGYDVIGPANSVAEALALIARSGCDAAVLDINLGAETAEPVARELIRRGTPFIATSGYTREQQPELMRTAPLLGKPLKPELLIAEIVRCLGG